jgi:nucleoside-diphosphate-sugar epimerase
MVTALVTGGAGFIGSHLVRALLARGNKVRVIDNFSTGSKDNLSGLEDHLLIVEADLRDQQQVRSVVQGVDVIYHLAAFVSVAKSMIDPQECFEVNVGGTVNLFDAARSAGVRCVVLSSSTAVYGESQELPLHEDLHPVPLSPYAVSKQVNEVYARFYTRVFALPVVSLRYFNVYGPRQSPFSEYAAVIPIFINQILSHKMVTIFGDGRQSRDFIFVEDVVRANLIAAERPDLGGEIFNICTGQETNLLDLLETLSELVPGPIAPQFAPPRPGDIYRSIGSPRKAAQILGFQQRVNLSEGLAQTVDAMKAIRAL